MRKLLIAVLFLLAVGVAAKWWLSPARPPASQAFVGGVVLTMDATNRQVEAVLVEGERITAVGSRAEIEGRMRDDTLVHDLAGRSLLPGFIDAHGHFPGSGLSELGADLNSPPIGRIENLEGLLDGLRDKAADTPAGEWVFGFGYDDTLLEEKRHPTREDLDRASSEHPIFILHVSGHMGVANGLALERAGVDAATPNPEGGLIVKDASTGELTGLLEENAAEPVQRLAMAYSVFDAVAMVKAASREYAQVGVTTAQSGGVDLQMAQGLVLAAKLGMIPLRLELWPLHDKLGPKLLDGSVDAASLITERVRLGPIKVIADGSIQGYTGYLTEPYHVPFHGDETYRGYARVPRDALFDAVRTYHQAGYQLAIHTNGDASIDDALDALRAAHVAYPRDDTRPILIHAQMARDDQLDVMRELGVTPSFFSAHTYYWGDRHAAIFMGPERAARMSPTRSAIDRGVRFTVHLDTPVTPMLPLLGVWSTVNRISTGGQVIGSEQRISPMQALRAVTSDAAWQIFREDEVGSIEVGKFADLVVLDGNPLEKPERIRDLEVTQTLVGGVTIYQRGE